MEKPNLPNPELCTIAIVFPIDNDEQIISVKKRVSEAVKDLPQVKIEYRFTELRNNG